MGNTIVGKKDYKDVGDAVGMPDDIDKQRIERMIAKFEQKNPGYLLSLRNYARDNSVAGTNEYGLVSASKGRGISSDSGRYMMELPEELHKQIEEYIPTMWRSKKHLAWFCKHFKYLMIPSKR